MFVVLFGSVIHILLQYQRILFSFVFRSACTSYWWHSNLNLVKYLDVSASPSDFCYLDDPVIELLLTCEYLLILCGDIPVSEAYINTFASFKQRDECIIFAPRYLSTGTNS